MRDSTRALVTVLGLDQHEAGALAVARLLRDAGVEVIYTGRFNTPQTIAAIAADEDVDVVGVSCHSWEFLHYAAELSSLLHGESPPIPVVIGGSIVTATDRDEVVAGGVEARRRGERAGGRGGGGEEGAAGGSGHGRLHGRGL